MLSTISYYKNSIFYHISFTIQQAEIALNGAKTKLKNCEKKVNLRKSEYEKKLKEVMDVHENATESLQLLSTNDIAVLKSMKSPPRPVKLVAEALVYIKVGTNS